LLLGHLRQRKPAEAQPAKITPLHVSRPGMTYAVKEIFYTLQGEGAQSGRAAVFCRFAGCNLWSGREEDRATAVCKFCDTDFVGTDGTGGGKFVTADALADAIEKAWEAPGKQGRYVVLTGGEPLLQVDEALHRRPACTRLHDCCRNQWHGGGTAGSGLDLRQPQGPGRGCAHPGQ
jgi:hypothetical protein